MLKEKSISKKEYEYVYFFFSFSHSFLLLSYSSIFPQTQNAYLLIVLSKEIYLLAEIQVWRRKKKQLEDVGNDCYRQNVALSSIYYNITYSIW